MDFLTAALYCDSVQGDGVTETANKLAGVLMTRFDPLNDVSRAKVVYATANELANAQSSGLMPRGFKVENGVLFSDTDYRVSVESELASYVGHVFRQECCSEDGLIDIVLQGAEYSCSVILNPDEYLSGSSPIIVPFSSYKVSDSSFNIYAPYKLDDGSFRTHSLIDIETEEVQKFTVLLDENSINDMRIIQKFSTGKVREVTPEENTRQLLYEVEAPLVGMSTMTGEGFCNYLAYSVAYYRMGLKILDHFLSDSGYTPPIRKEPATRKKVPKRNYAIVSTLKKPMVQEIMNVLNDGERLRTMCTTIPEASITYNWLQQIMTIQREFDGETLDERLVAACGALRVECKRKLLHFSCELLAQRLYLITLGRLGDSLGPTLRGGGVNGFAIKRASW